MNQQDWDKKIAEIRKTNKALINLQEGTDDDYDNSLDEKAYLEQDSLLRAEEPYGR